jgi:hypothetical protein
MQQLNGRRWLRVDALNRAWRTVLQGLVVAVAAAAGDAAVQVIQRAVADAAAGGSFDWQQVAATAAYAAGTAALMAVVAYLHRYRVDPSGVPSAVPPAPTPTPSPPS